MALTKVNLVSPIPVYLDEVGNEGALAERPASLEGKVVGLLPNWRPAGAQILKALGALMEKRYRLKGVVLEEHRVLTSLRQGGSLLERMRDQLDRFAERVDVAIVASGD